MVFAIAGRSHADPHVQVPEWGNTLQELRKQPRGDEQKLAKCRDVLKKETAELKPTDAIRGLGDAFKGLDRAFNDGGNLHLKVADVLTICDEIDKYVPFLAPAQALGDALKAAEDIDLWLEMGSGITEENLAGFSKPEPGCRAAAAAMLKSPYQKMGIQTRTAWRTIDVATASAAVCDKLTSQIARFKQGLADQAAENKKWWEETAAPYRKAGASGEKLEFLVSMHDRALYAVGGKEMTTPKALAAANVMFEVLTGSDGAVTIRRYTWKGNKGTGMTQKNYPTRPGAGAFR